MLTLPPCPIKFREYDKYFLEAKWVKARLNELLENQNKGTLIIELKKKIRKKKKSSSCTCKLKIGVFYLYIISTTHVLGLYNR